MESDIEEAKRLGVKGIVLGLLTRDGNIDVKKTQALLRRCGSLEVTFHRAFDMTPDPFEALQTLIDLGIQRVLTSGQEATAPEGAALLAKLVDHADQRISIMPGGGIDEQTIATLLPIEGIKELHATGSEVLESDMTFRNERIYMGSPGLPEYALVQTNEQKIRGMVSQL